VSRLLHSLACVKYQILTKDPAGRTISKADKFKCVGAVLQHQVLLFLRSARCF
jgi:hypothetical protein